MSKENETSDKQQNGNDFIADVSVSVCQCEKPDIWMKVYEGLMCLNCMKPPKAD